MVTMTLTVPNAVAAELNAYAVTCGYANAKEMMIAYLKHELIAARQAAIVQQTANANDAVIT